VSEAAEDAVRASLPAELVVVEDLAVESSRPSCPLPSAGRPSASHDPQPRAGAASSNRRPPRRPARDGGSRPGSRRRAGRRRRRPTSRRCRTSGRHPAGGTTRRFSSRSAGAPVRRVVQYAAGRVYGRSEVDSFPRIDCRLLMEMPLKSPIYNLSSVAYPRRPPRAGVIRMSPSPAPAGSPSRRRIVGRRAHPCTRRWGTTTPITSRRTPTSPLPSGSRRSWIDAIEAAAAVVRVVHRNLTVVPD
jgi:hypothetical protein